MRDSNDKKYNTLQLKVSAVGIGIIGAVFYFWAIPNIGIFITKLSPEYARAYIPWLILLWITAVPCYITLILLWQVIRSMDRDMLFRIDNAERFKKISYLVFFDTILFFIANIIFMVLGLNHITILISAVFLCLIGTAFGICMRAVADFFEKAAGLQNESDLTI